MNKFKVGDPAQIVSISGNVVVNRVVITMFINSSGVIDDATGNNNGIEGYGYRTEPSAPGFNGSWLCESMLRPIPKPATKGFDWRKMKKLDIQEGAS